MAKVAVQIGLDKEIILGDSDSLSAVIYKQSPAKGRIVLPGSEIDVWITTDQSKLNESSPVEEPADSPNNNLGNDELDEY